MSNILNKKEEVLKIELTKHGRRMLGLGLFRPEYFALLDDSIIYDQNYGGVSGEDQNNIQNRLLNTDLAFSAFNLTEEIELQPIGNSSIFFDYAPSWSISLLKGEFDMINSASYYKKDFTFKNINYGIEIINNNDTLLRNDNNSQYNIDENRYLEVRDDYILLDISELNVSDDKENFSIEIETYDDFSGGLSGETPRKLHFYQKYNNIIDGILYEENELPSKFTEPNITEEIVEYYFDILVDDEIDANILRAAADPFGATQGPDASVTSLGAVAPNYDGAGSENVTDNPNGGATKVFVPTPFFGPTKVVC